MIFIVRLLRTSQKENGEHGLKSSSVPGRASAATDVLPAAASTLFRPGTSNVGSGEDGITREAVLRTGPEGLTEIAVEGAPAPGGGRYAGFGPWPTAGPGGITAFIAALDGGPGPLAAFAGAASDIRQVATMGETLPQGELIGRFALNAVAVAGC